MGTVMDQKKATPEGSSIKAKRAASGAPGNVKEQMALEILD